MDRGIQLKMPRNRTQAMTAKLLTFPERLG
jgi:hypothetical protein